jgi:phosphopantothenoylcysteine synthetase/decarboxylase
LKKLVGPAGLEADDLVSALVLHSEIPVFMVPALNPAARKNQFVQRNLRELTSAGINIILDDAEESISVVSMTRQPGIPSVKTVVTRVQQVLAEEVGARKK